MQMDSRNVLLISLVLISLQSLSCHTMSPLLTEQFKTQVEVPPHAINDQVFSPQHLQRVFSVDDFGAEGRGNDDREAFMKAWNEACHSDVPATYLVPENKRYLLKPVNFDGPCKYTLSSLA